jgi:hypothetical protein
MTEPTKVRERGGLSYFGGRVNKAESVFGERGQRPLSWLVGSAISPGGRELNLDFNKGNTRRKPVIAAEGNKAVLLIPAQFCLRSWSHLLSCFSQSPVSSQSQYTLLWVQGSAS